MLFLAFGIYRNIIENYLDYIKIKRGGLRCCKSPFLIFCVCDKHLSISFEV